MNGPEPVNEKLPYRDSCVTFIKWLPDHSIATTNEVRVKREWLTEGLPLYAAWPGQWRTDVFTVDIDKAAEVIG